MTLFHGAHNSMPAHSNGDKSSLKQRMCSCGMTFPSRASLLLHTKVLKDHVPVVKMEGDNRR